MVFQFEWVNKLFPSITQSRPGSEHRISHTAKLQGGESDGEFGMDRWKKNHLSQDQQGERTMPGSILINIALSGRSMVRQELSLSSVGTSDLGLHLFLSLIFHISEMGKKR